jgi:hypothetical protein
MGFGREKRKADEGHQTSAIHPTFTKDNAYRYTGENVANLYESTSDDPILRKA